MLAGDSADETAYLAIRSELGLDESIPVQYTRWLAGVFGGNLGKSYFLGRPVSELVGRTMFNTFQLVAGGLIVGLLIGLPLGIAAGASRSAFWDNFLSVFTAIVLGIPNFVLGILLLRLLAVTVPLFPAGGFVSLFDNPAQGLRFMLLPSLALGLHVAAVQGRFLRTSLIESLGSDYVRTAYAKGLKPRVVTIRHALRNSLITQVTVLGLQVGRLMAGAVVVEVVFAWPGMGTLIVEAIRNRDYLVIQSSLLLLVSVFILINLLVDVSYGLIDPRIRVR